jgi:integrase
MNCIRQSKTRAVRARRVSQKKIYEETTINHGTGKHLKISVETTSESFESFIDNSNALSSVTDTDDILAFIRNSKNKRLCADSPDDEYAEFEEIKQQGIPSLVEQEIVPKLEGKKDLLLACKDQKFEKQADNPKVLRKSIFKKAKQMLDKAIPKGNNTGFRLIHEDYKDEGNYSREYVINPQEKDVDFTQFANPEDFEKAINLKGKTLIECIVEYVKTRAIKYPSIKSRYQVLIGYIMMIEEKWRITLMPVVIGNMFWPQFESFLYNNELASRTITNICLELRAVIKWASMYGALLSVDFNEVELKPVDSKPKVTLTEDEISRLRWFDLNTVDCREDHRKTLEIVRDHFILSCYLGQRFSDTVRIDETNFLGASKEIFRIIQKKTGNKAVLDFNKIFPEFPVHARAILEKYDYSSPYNGDICNYNRWLHELCRIVGLNDEIKYEYKFNGKIITKSYEKWELISSHTARRTFITLAVKRSVNSQYIKRASGHKSDSSFDKYIIFDDNA